MRRALPLTELDQRVLAVMRSVGRELYSVDVARVLGAYDHPQRWRETLRIKASLMKLERRGLLTSTWSAAGTGMGRRFFKLTRRGRAAPPTPDPSSGAGT